MNGNAGRRARINERVEITTIDGAIRRLEPGACAVEDHGAVARIHGAQGTEQAPAEISGRQLSQLRAYRQLVFLSWH